MEVAKLMDIFGISHYYLDSDAIEASSSVNGLLKDILSGSAGVFIGKAVYWTFPIFTAPPIRICYLN